VTRPKKQQWTVNAYYRRIAA
jgi:transposase